MFGLFVRALDTPHNDVTALNLVPVPRAPVIYGGLPCVELGRIRHTVFSTVAIKCKHQILDSVCVLLVFVRAGFVCRMILTNSPAMRANPFSCACIIVDGHHAPLVNCLTWRACRIWVVCTRSAVRRSIYIVCASLLIRVDIMLTSRLFTLVAHPHLPAYIIR